MKRERSNDTQPSAKSIQVGEGSNLADSVSPARWQPSISIGSPLWLEGEDPSRIEIADRNIAQKRLWVEQYRGIPEFTKLLDEAISERGQLDENNVEHAMPQHVFPPPSTIPSTHRNAIAERLQDLRDVLQDSTFPPERQNISAAITGYESGAIPFSSEHYTLIWAGRIVDRCPDYASFTHDRAERLDGYHTAHGSGWLWYEPPLTTSSAPVIRAKKGLCLPNVGRTITEDMGHYTIRMSFRRRQVLTSRPAPSAAAAATPAEISNAIVTGPSTSEPRVFYDMLLDSGATFPCLFESDLPTLNIDPRTYSAVCARRLATAQGTLATKTYELDVGVHGGDGSSLYGALPPGGEAVPDRLSGILPFHVAYWSSAPGNYKLWLGEERREVLGAGRLPGQMRFAAWKENFAGAPRSWPRPALPFSLDTGRPKGIERLGLGTPDRVVFEHELPGTGGVVRDRDAGGGRSVITVGPRGATGQKRDVYRVEPRKWPDQQVALTKRKRQPSGGSESSEKSPTSGRNLRQRTK
ncbi:hypothetical protein B0T18DRAFT_457249 [Schizothecium vesticola]|uniref:Uncharacterized protein n=1 Tax=Schizothecium vesticola TaxID=314040 RepID=A0AA40F5F0_9PEZI|nr:hypothetical protein B0T18DRAFT_457249 [Schizothecium vesticola]